MRYLACLIVLIVYVNISFSQTDSVYTPKKIKITAGQEYDMGGFSEIFLGEHWRDLWTTPFEADILDLEKYGGGLTPYKKGGGLQTKSLRFKGNDGKLYKFRSINKDPEKLLPPDLRETFVADAVKDQISTSHPFSAMIVAPILNSVGILNAQPRVVVIPDDERLGGFRKEFKNLLGTIEEHPDEGPDGEPGFAGSDKVVGSSKLLEKLEEDNDDQVDHVEFLKARLVDIFLGDWDRHSDQWRWARFKQNGKKIWKPIPRDRDQAFCLYDGLIPMIVGKSITQIEGYGKDYPKIYDLTWNGRYVDRRFLPPLEKNVWDSLATFVQKNVTDSVIVNAVKKMPPEWFKRKGKYLINLIKLRRDKLKEASDEYYELIAETVDIYGSNKSEYLEVNRLDDDRVEVLLYKLDKKTGDKKGEPFLKKTFNVDETGEIRVYLLGGKDRAVINGEVDNSILVRIIAGTGKDELIDNSKVNGYFLSFTPITDAENMTLYYHKGKSDKITKGPSTSVYKDDYVEPDNILERYEPKVENRGYDWRFGPILDYDSDNGLILGGGPILYKHGFRTEPYVYRMELSGAYATNLRSYMLIYNGDFYSLIKGVKVLLYMGKTQLSINDFYGFGNETIFNENLDRNDYYDISQDLFIVKPTFEFKTSEVSAFSIGASYRYSDITSDDNTFMSMNRFYGFGNFSYIGFHTLSKFDSRDSDIYPYKGFYADIYGDYYPELLNNDNQFGKAGFDVRTYLTTDAISRITLALRTVGEKVWGTFPFYEAAFLGGSNSLRGFNQNRFAGDASLLGQVELRMKIARINILIPAELGISVFGEVGRVFLNGEESKKWHNAYGGGIWMSYVARMLNLGLDVGNSKDGLVFYLTTGFSY